MFSAPFSLFLFVSLLSACVLHQLIAASVHLSLSVCRPRSSLCLSALCKIVVGITLFLCIVWYCLDLFLFVLSPSSLYTFYLCLFCLFIDYTARFSVFTTFAQCSENTPLRCSLF